MPKNAQKQLNDFNKYFATNSKTNTYNHIKKLICGTIKCYH